MVRSSCNVNVNGCYYEARTEVLAFANEGDTGLIKAYTLYGYLRHHGYSPGHFGTSVDIVENDFELMGYTLSHNIDHYVDYFRRISATKIDNPQIYSANTILITLHNVEANVHSRSF